MPRVLSFVQHDLPIDLPTIEAFRGRGDGTKEMTVAELVRTGQNRRGARQTGATRRWRNFYFRMVEVLMMLLVPFLAVALAVPPKRSTSGLGIFLAIVFVVTYHKVNQYAEQMGALGRIDPLIAVGTPFLDLRRPDPVDVLDARPQARRPAHRRPRTRVRAHLQARRAGCSAAAPRRPRPIAADPAA